MNPGAMIVRSLFLLGVLLGACACERVRELFPEIPPVFTDPTATDWGTYAAGLDVPACPSAQVLLVNTTADPVIAAGSSLTDPAQLGASLSFRQALWIAANRAGPETILFDAAIFPVDKPATIALRPVYDEMPPTPGTLCIDARSRGVVIDFTSASGDCASCVWPLGEGSLEVGLTLLHVPFEQAVYKSQVAGCRINTDGVDVFQTDFARPWAMELRDKSTFGPGNVVAGSSLGVRLLSGSDSHVFRNGYGYDFLTRRCLVIGGGIDTLGPCTGTISGNVFCSTREAIRADYFTATSFTVRDNFFGVTPTLARLGTSPTSAAQINIGDWTFGPGNVVRGAKIALALGTANVRITRNSISQGEQGIVFSTTAPLEPPNILSASASAVMGSCAIAGTVELFADPGDEAARFLGDAVCGAGGVWSIAVLPPEGQNLTATLTDAQGHTSAFSTPFPVP